MINSITKSLYSIILKILTTGNLKNSRLLEPLRLVINWYNLIIIGEINGDEAVVRERGQALGVVKQRSEETGCVLLEVFLICHFPASFSFNSQVKLDAAILRVGEPIITIVHS